MAIAKYLKEARASAGALRAIRRSNADVLFVNATWPHHARRSGYHLIAEHIGVSLDGKNRLLPWPVVRMFRAASFNPVWEAQLFLRMALWFSKQRYIHICDGDFCRWPVSPPPQRIGGRKVSATFHQPPDQLSGILRTAPKNVFDTVIAVARCQVPVLADTFGADRVRFVPHGVDTDYFRPAERARDPRLVLSVGVHRRDFETLARAAHLLRSKSPELRIVWVGPKEHAPMELFAETVEVRSGISDEALRSLYQRAVLMLLPLEASTANNSLLEAMASGLPVVTTEIEGCADYVDSSWCISCAPGDARVHAQAALDVLKDGQRRSRMERAARDWSLRFDWGVVRDKFLRVLRERDGDEAPTLASGATANKMADQS